MTEKKNKFAEHVRKMQEEDNEGKYRASQFYADARKIGAEMDFLFGRPCGAVFTLDGTIDCDGEKIIIGVSIVPRMYLVSVPETVGAYEKVFRRFAELFDQEPDVVYHDKGNMLNTAEYWPDASDEWVKNNLTQIETCPNYEIIRKQQEVST